MCREPGLHGRDRCVKLSPEGRNKKRHVPSSSPYGNHENTLRAIPNRRLRSPVGTIVGQSGSDAEFLGVACLTQRQMAQRSSFSMFLRAKRGVASGSMDFALVLAISPSRPFGEALLIRSMYGHSE